MQVVYWNLSALGNVTHYLFQYKQSLTGTGLIRIPFYFSKSTVLSRLPWNSAMAFSQDWSFFSMKFNLINNLLVFFTLFFPPIWKCTQNRIYTQRIMKSLWKTLLVVWRDRQRSGNNLLLITRKTQPS